jgi:hypothetical protein
VDRFKDRFSVDYLKGSSSSSSLSADTITSGPSSSLPNWPSTEDALLTYSRPVMDALAKADGLTLRVFDLAQSVGGRVDVLYPVIEYLMSRGIIVRTQPDNIGNDEIQLTPQGLQLVKR